jgi:ABC-type Mn2+/Zn2+ transport system permease subunit
MMALGVVFCMVFTTAGLACSYTLELPSGPTIILFAVPVYLAGTVFSKHRVRTE